MRDCKGIQQLDSSVVETAIHEILHSKIVPNLLNCPRVKPEKSSLTMETTHKYEFHQSDVASLTKHLMDGDIGKAEQLLIRHTRSGCSSTDIVLNLLTPVARLMGEKWCSDAASFAEVTLGMMELHTILRSLEVNLRREFSPHFGRENILFTVMPGDTHIFGISVLQSFFIANGWNVDVMLDPTAHSIFSRVARTRYDIIGFSVSNDKDVVLCENLLEGVRNKSLNPDIVCMVGGLPFNLAPGLAETVGADHMASDAFEALAIAASICEKKPIFESSSDYAQ